MSAAKAMILAWLGLALNCVAVGNFAFCHECEATILAFGISAQRSAVGNQPDLSPQKVPRMRRNRSTSSEFWLFFASQCDEKVSDCYFCATSSATPFC
jgi:hypothetical protein